jgi:heme/copper-type cytochrome/quinol oxidase subunit 2
LNPGPPEYEAGTLDHNDRLNNVTVMVILMVTQVVLMTVFMMVTFRELMTIRKVCRDNGGYGDYEAVVMKIVIIVVLVW